MILLVEDAESRIREFKRELIGFPLRVARTVDEAVAAWNERPPRVLFLDHDLGQQADLDSDDPQTGAEFIRRIKAQDPEAFDAVAIVIHSLNPPGARNMQALLGFHVELVPFLNIQWSEVRENVAAFCESAPRGQGESK